MPRRSFEDLTIGILEYIKNNPGSSRNDLRLFTKDDRTVKRYLTFLQRLNAITINKEESGKLDTWHSTITKIGKLILESKNSELEKEDEEIIQEEDRGKLRKFFINAKTFGCIDQKILDEADGYLNIWKNSDNEKTTKREIFHRLVEILDILIKKCPRYENSETMKYYNLLIHSIVELNKELSFK